MADRQKAAALARELYDKKIDFDTFATSVVESDNDIGELVYLITHEPKCGGFMGVTREQHESYMKDIWHLIELLEQSVEA